jgi:hypothetical protein
MIIILSIMEKMNLYEGKLILMGLNPFGLIRKEECLNSMVLLMKTSTFTSKNLNGDGT